MVGPGFTSQLRIEFTTFIARSSGLLNTTDTRSVRTRWRNGWPTHNKDRYFAFGNGVTAVRVRHAVTRSLVVATTWNTANRPARSPFCDPLV